MSVPDSDQPRRLGPEILAGVLAVAVFGVPSLAFPLGIDQGQQDAIGRLMADGLVLYRDIWDNRSPLLYVMAALGHLVGLHGTVGIRVADLLYQAATAGLLALLVARSVRFRGAGFLAAAFYGWTYYGQSHYLHTCQPDGRLALFVVASLLLLEGSKARPARQVVAGVLWGLAFLTKYPAAAAGLPLAAVLWWQGRDGFVGRFFRLVAGFALPAIGWLIYMAATGALEPFWIATFHFNSGYRQIGAEISGVAAALREAAGLLLLHREVVAPLLLFGIVRERRGLGPLALWAVAGLVMLFGQGKFYETHLYGALAPLAALSGVAVAGTIKLIADGAVARRARLVRAVALLLAVGCGFRTLQVWSNSARITWSVTRDPGLEREYLAAHGTTNGFSILDSVEVARFLEAERREGDRLLVYGFPPILYSLTGFAPASRFVSNPPLISTFRWKDYDRQFDEELAARAPDYVVVSTQDSVRFFVGTDQTSAQLVSLHPRLEALLASMQRICSTPTLDVYSRRPAQRAVCPGETQGD